VPGIGRRARRSLRPRVPNLIKVQANLNTLSAVKRRKKIHSVVHILLPFLFYTVNREQIWCTRAPMLLVFEKIQKLYFCISQKYIIYSLNTYTCFEYSCEVSVEFHCMLSYWKKIVATYRLKFC
jgi:hypothetical protein